MRDIGLLFLCQLLLLAGPLALASALAASPTSTPTSSTSCHDDYNVVDVASSSDTLRGGDGVMHHDGIDHKTRDTILRFLDSSTNNKGASSSSSSSDEYPFHIQGWRWHFMSLIRDSKRLERLANRLSHINEREYSEDDTASGFEALEQAANYVVNFNMKGLYRIQSDMFVKFLREHLCEEKSIEQFSEGGNVAAETKAFNRIVDKIDDYRVQSETMGKELYKRAKAASNSSKSYHHKKQLLNEVAKSSRQLSNQLAYMRSIQETLIVPAISRVVPSKVQKSFNNKVLLNLGLLESRTHLVGMHDAVWESGNEDEKQKFETEIPYVARIMIERWRHSLYLPKAGALDYGLTA